MIIHFWNWYAAVVKLNDISQTVLRIWLFLVVKNLIISSCTINHFMPYVIWTHMVNHVLLNFIPPFNMALHSCFALSKEKYSKNFQNDFWLCEIWCPCVQLLEERNIVFSSAHFSKLFWSSIHQLDKSTFIIIYISTWCKVNVFWW